MGRRLPKQLPAVSVRSAALRPSEQTGGSRPDAVVRGRAAHAYRASVQLSEKASALVLKGRPSRSVGHDLPLASTPLRESRVPSAGIKSVHTP